MKKQYKNSSDTILIYSFVTVLFLFVVVSFLSLPHGKKSSYVRCKCPKKYQEIKQTVPDGTILCEPMFPSITGETKIKITCIR